MGTKQGVVCSLLLLLLFPALCLLCSLGGLCLAVTAPLWAPLLALLYHLCIILVWDVDNPDPARCPRPLFPLLRVLGLDLLTGGLLQPVACLATALFLCPLLAFLLSLCECSCSRRVGRLPPAAVVLIVVIIIKLKAKKKKIFLLKSNFNVMIYSRNSAMDANPGSGWTGLPLDHPPEESSAGLGRMPCAPNSRTGTGR